MVGRTETGMTLVLIDSLATLTPAEWPRTPRFVPDVEHSSRLQEVSERSAVLVTDNIRMRSPDQTALL